MVDVFLVDFSRTCAIVVQVCFFVQLVVFVGGTVKIKNNVREKTSVLRKLLRITGEVSRVAENGTGVKYHFYAGGGCGAVSVSLPMGSSLDAPTELAYLRGELAGVNKHMRITEGAYSSTPASASIQFSYQRLPNGHAYRDQ